MKLTLNKAAKECGRAKSTILEAINSNRMSAPKDERGRYQIDPAELFRVFPKPQSNEQSEPIPTTSTDHENRIKIAQLEAEVTVLRERVENRETTIENIKGERDEWRKQAQTLAVTDQSKAQGWWPFGRKSA